MASEGSESTGSGRTQPVWFQQANVPSFPALSADAEADVCIIGGGLAGMTTAYLLALEGVSVLLLEDGLLGGGETGRTTAHLANALDDRYMEIERLHGEAGARLAADSHTAAIDRIERAVREEGIPCDFERVDGYLVLSPRHRRQFLDDELAAVQRAGLHEVELVDAVPLRDVQRPCLRFPNQGQFHPLRYLSGLAHAVVTRGGRLHTRTHVTKVDEGTPAQVHTATGAIVRAGAVVVATNTPVNDRVTMHTKQAAYRTYVIGVPVSRGSVPKGLYWDTEDPYHYVRLQPLDDTTDVLMVGGEDHKTGQAEDVTRRHHRLLEWARAWFPNLQAPSWAWSGQIMEPIDGLAFIGRNPGGSPNVYIATGDSGMGMTHGTIAGMLLTDLICGRQNAWAPLYDPSRVRVSAAPEFARENFNIAAQYLEWVTAGDVRSPDEIPVGQGAIVRKGATKLAVYRDADGVVHARSAVCPHLGCLVSWNAEEKTWDCPCHGSRFDRHGTVLNGPANTNLAEAE